MEAPMLANNLSRVKYDRVKFSGLMPSLINVPLPSRGQEMVETELSFRLWYNPDRGSDKTRTNPQPYLALPHSVFIPRADVSEAKRSSHTTP